MYSRANLSSSPPSRMADSHTHMCIRTSLRMICMHSRLQSHAQAHNAYICYIQRVPGEHLVCFAGRASGATRTVCGRPVDSGLCKPLQRTDRYLAVQVTHLFMCQTMRWACDPGHSMHILACSAVQSELCDERVLPYTHDERSNHILQSLLHDSRTCVVPVQ